MYIKRLKNSWGNIYKDMRPVSNQPGRLYATAKIHKFSSLDEITIEKLKFRPIISQVGTYTYNAAKVIADYLKPLCQNEYKINDTQSFPSIHVERSRTTESK